MPIIADLSQTDLIAAMLVHGATHVGRNFGDRSKETHRVILAVVKPDERDRYLCIAVFERGKWTPYNTQFEVLLREAIPITDLIKG